MARSARDVALCMAALDPRAMSADDPRVPPLPPPDVAGVDVARLRVGVHLDDGLVPPSAAVARAVREAADALRSRGATVVDFTPPGLPDVFFDYLGAMTADGGATGLAWIDGDPIDRTFPRAHARAPSRASRRW